MNKSFNAQRKERNEIFRIVKKIYKSSREYIFLSCCVKWLERIQSAAMWNVGTLRLANTPQS